MDAQKAPYEFLARFDVFDAEGKPRYDATGKLDARLSGAHVKFITVVNDDGQVSATEGAAEPVDIGQGKGFPLDAILGDMQIGAIARADELEAKLSERTAVAEELAGKVDELTAQSEELTKALADAASGREMLIRERDEALALSAEKVASLEGAAQARESEFSAARAQINVLKASLESARKRVDDLELDRASLAGG